MSDHARRWLIPYAVAFGLVLGAGVAIVVGVKGFLASQTPFVVAILLSVGAVVLSVASVFLGPKR